MICHSALKPSGGVIMAARSGEMNNLLLSFFLGTGSDNKEVPVSKRGKEKVFLFPLFLAHRSKYSTAIAVAAVAATRQSLPGN